MLGTRSLLSATSSCSATISYSRSSLVRIPLKQWRTTDSSANGVTRPNKDLYIRQVSKLTRLRRYQDDREVPLTHKKYFPDSFVFRRGDHPYGTREYLLVQRKSQFDETSNDNPNIARSSQDSRQKGTTTPTIESLPTELVVLATLHANNNVVFGASRNANMFLDAVPSILDLCPILLHTALSDCSKEGEQPHALATLHGLSAWVRQCLNVEMSTVQSSVIQALHEQIQNPTCSSSDNFLKTTNLIGRRPNVVDARQQLECITAIATNVPRPGHSVVGQKTHADGALAWEALCREFAVLDNNDRTIELSEECLLYRRFSESCELVEIELLADTSPAYLLSAGGAMARFFIT